MSGSRLYFKNLDAIRFIAAFMVFLQHGMSMTPSYWGASGSILVRFIKAISSGSAGVSIFFVLSGFLITYLLITEYETRGGIMLRHFYIRRILRIWPLYYAVVIFSFFIYPFFKARIGIISHSRSDVFYYLTFLSNFDLINVEKHFPGQDVSSQNITWSVSVEEQFYLIWPLTFTFLPRKLWVWVISAVIIGSMAFRIMHYDDPNVLYFSTFSVLMDLGMGGLMAYLMKTNLRLRSFFESTSTWTHLLLFIAAAILLMFGDIIVPGPYSMAILRMLTAFTFAMIITSQAMTTQGSVLDLGNFSFGNKWGKYTYGIYLIHPIALNIVDILLRLIHVKNETFLVSLGTDTAAFLLTLLMSWLSYTFFESRFLALKEKFAIIKSH